MAKGLNRVQLLGNVGRIEVRATRGGSTVASVSLATPERMKDLDGEWKDTTEWHNLVAFGRTAEILRDYAGKGARLFVEGKLQTRSWDDKESGQKRYRTEVMVQDVTLLGDPKGGKDRKDASGGESPEQAYNSTYFPDANQEITDSDVPF